MVKLRWLQVNKFRTVKPGTRLTFNPGYNVLLGQNGTGKTTLLNLVAAAIKSDFSSFKDVEFDLSYEFSSDQWTATVSVQSETRSPPIASALEGISSEHLLPGVLTSDGGLRNRRLSTTVNLSEEQTGLQLKISFEGNRGTAQRIDEKGREPVFDLDFSRTEGWPLWGLILTGVSQWSSMASVRLHSMPALVGLFFASTTVRRFDESLDYFNGLSDLHIELLRYPDGKISYTGNLEPLSVMHEHLSTGARHQWGADRYVLTHKDLQYLKRTIQLLDFESAEAIVELKNSTTHATVDVMRLGNLRFYFSHRGGWKISEKLLSYGQKRMLSFMHYLAASGSVVIADELVNGLHHHWIKACFEALEQRQLFLTSQNPLLLDYLNFKSSEEVQSTFVLCRWEKGPEQMVWENMSQEAAADFFDSYKVGFQQVGELLQSKGLW